MHSGESSNAMPPTCGASDCSPYDGKIAGLYDLEETLGSGHFAVVKLARHVFTGAKVAVKVVDKTKLDDVSKAHLFQEVRCMKLVQHPNVVRLYEVIDTQTKLYLVLELGDGGDLYDYIMKHEGGLSEDLARKYFRQILRAIAYCHQLHVVHRDLKPENVVFFEKLGVVKLTDFGFSNKFSPGKKLETFCGSLAYSAPEILLGDSYDAPAVDIWSLGVILYMLVCGQPPFEKANDSETLTMIMDCKYTVPSQVTQNCQRLIASMLVRDPKKRASLEEIAANPWLQEHSVHEINDYLPLVSRQELSEEDHTFIIQKMINGNIAPKEDILQSLDKNKYNHITATYFLLAEMRLRKRCEDQNKIKQNQEALLNRSTEESRNHGKAPETLSDDVRGSIVPRRVDMLSSKLFVREGKPEKRNRKCSIVREEEEDDSIYEKVGDGKDLKVALKRRESISDGRINQSIQERTNCIASLAGPAYSQTKPLVQKSTQICCTNTNVNTNSDISEEQQDMIPINDIEHSVLQKTLGDLRGLNINKIKPLSNSKNPILAHRRTKITKIRTPSCSSSEASDDDTKSRNKKKINKFVGDSPARFRMHRRDSHDDSSDSQDQTYSSSGAHKYKTNIVNKNSKFDEKKECQSQDKGQQKSEYRSKTSQNLSLKDLGHSRHIKYVKKMFSTKSVRRRGIRESQSLDRITELQEFEQGNRNLTCTNIEQINLLNANSLYCSKTKDKSNQLSQRESKEVKKKAIKKLDLVENTRNPHSVKTILSLKHIKNCNMYNLNSIGEVDLILEEKNIRAIHVTNSKCFVTIKKIRKLGKYFPGLNFP